MPTLLYMGISPMLCDLYGLVASPTFSPITAPVSICVGLIHLYLDLHININAFGAHQIIVQEPPRC